MMGTSYSIDTITSQDELSLLESDWNRLSESATAPNVFTTFGWFWAWTRRRVGEVGRGRFEPHVLLLKRNDAVVGIAPLIRRRFSRFGFSVRKLEFVTNHADYNDLVLGDDAADQVDPLIEFLSQTRTEWDLIDLRDLRGTGNAIARIERALASAGLRYRLFGETERCPYLSIDGDAASLMKRLSGHTRRTLRRRMEQAVSDGLSMRIIQNPWQEPSLLKKLIALDHQKHLRSLNPPFVGTYPEVFQYLFDELGPRGWLYVALLEKGDHPVAFQLGFRCGGKLWDYTKAYDRSFCRFAPGSMLLTALLDYGFEQGYYEYDFLRGEEQYKKVWSTGFHPRFRLLIWNRRWMSRLCVLVYSNSRVRAAYARIKENFSA
jgi:CelD/BcsL family acetyltransferase involved in cellulose biosynthesis